MAFVDLEEISEPVVIHHVLPEKQSDMTGFDGKSFSSKIEYLNFTGRDIKVTDRRGFVIQMRSIDPSLMNTNSRLYEKALYIRVQYMANAKTMGGLDVQNHADMDASEVHPFKAKLDEQITEHENLPFGRSRDLFMGSVVYKLTKEMLDNLNGAAYLPELDIVVATDLVTSYVHPASPEGKIAADMRQKEERIGTPVSFGFAIVDRAGLIGERFMKIGDEVYALEIDPTLDILDGIYRYDTAPLQHHPLRRNKKMKRRCTRLDPHDPQLGEKHGIWKTVEEARTSLSIGDLAKLREHRQIEMIRQQNAQLERELTQSKLENTQMKIDHDAAMMAAEARRVERQEVIDRENHAREIEKNSARDYYDQRASSRKDWTEVLKYMGAAITAIGAIALTVRSWMAMSAKSWIGKSLVALLL